MIAEIVLTYALMSTAPAYHRVPGPPYTDTELRLNLVHTVYRPRTSVNPLPLSGKLDLLRFLDVFKPEVELVLSPYVRGYEGSVGQAGGEAEINLKFKDFTLGFYHHSSHNLDVPGRAIDVNGIRLKWRLK